MHILCLKNKGAKNVICLKKKYRRKKERKELHFFFIDLCNQEIKKEKEKRILVNQKLFKNILMEKTNKNKYINLEKPINFCKLQDIKKQKEITLQTKGLSFLFAERFLNAVGAKRKTNKITQQQPFFLIEAEKKASMQLEQLKNKFINLLMRNGEKSKAYKLFAESLKQLEKQSSSKENISLLFLNNKKGKKNEKFLVQKKSNEEQIGGKKSQKNKTRDTKDKKDDLLYNKKKSIDYYNDFLKENILYQAVENVKPTLELRRVRKGGTTYQVPAIVSQNRQERLAIKCLIDSS